MLLPVVPARQPARTWPAFAAVDGNLYIGASSISQLSPCCKSRGREDGELDGESA